jgi:hypothetical protein
VVIARDVEAENGLGVSVKRFRVQVLPVSSIYHAEQWTGDPSAGGRLLSQEWTVPGTTIARREVADAVSTRTIVSCEAIDGGNWCPEARWRTLDSSLVGATPEDLDGFAAHVGAFLGDPNVREIGELGVPARLRATGSVPATSGPIGDALLPWQVPAPGHGTTHVVYEVPLEFLYNSGEADPTSGEYRDTSAAGTALARVFVDSTTHLPLRQTVIHSGVGFATFYFTYGPFLTKLADHPEDFVLVSPPEAAGFQQSVQYGVSPLQPRWRTSRLELRSYP